MKRVLLLTVRVGRTFFVLLCFPRFLGDKSKLIHHCFDWIENKGFFGVVVLTRLVPYPHRVNNDGKKNMKAPSMSTCFHRNQRMVTINLQFVKSDRALTSLTLLQNYCMEKLWASNSLSCFAVHCHLEISTRVAWNISTVTQTVLFFVSLKKIWALYDLR